ncbi:brassinosteroid-responsive RING protein 1-like [Cornus florida]|uniref:brassinosteroid-responsive RING protein 1-like n=1 Tax=Cornus florida TaxID=4283 RepID=UPI0028994335|nr:brassinosteroid-responsive RING protein 1-like [Cornus florida]
MWKSLSFYRMPTRMPLPFLHHHHRHHHHPPFPNFKYTSQPLFQPPPPSLLILSLNFSPDQVFAYRFVLLLSAFMGFSMEYSGLAVATTHVLYKAAFVFAVTRWFLSWVLRLIRDTDVGIFPFFSSSSSPDFLQQAQLDSSSSPSSCSISSKLVRDSLALTTFGDIAAHRVHQSCDTCAVCLDRLRERDEVRELGNCCHIFHSGCLDRWLDHDTHKTCPLCRSPLLTTTILSSSSQGLSQQQPSWVVERLLYLFGDDLLH